MQLIWLVGLSQTWFRKNKRNDRIEAMLLDIPEDKEVQWNEELFEKNGKPHNAYEKERFSSKESCHTQLVKPLEKSKVVAIVIVLPTTRRPSLHIFQPPTLMDDNSVDHYVTFNKVLLILCEKLTAIYWSMACQDRP
ncbi:hypothetical protein P8452_55543 [Trifolium repens]|nr:hypothetical protein P8452_55543 [Trifolium repens]